MVFYSKICKSFCLKWENLKSQSPKSAKPVHLSTSLDDEEVVTMATVRSLLAVQESMLKTLFESIMNRINARVDNLEKSMSDNITQSMNLP